MRKTVLVWKKRVSRARREQALHAIQKFYPKAEDNGDGIVAVNPESDSKLIWLFLLRFDFAERSAEEEA